MSDDRIKEKIADASKTIFSYCMSKTPTREEAEDLCQDILLELIKSSGNIRDPKAFYGFMWALADNVYKQWYRKKVMRNNCELTDDIPCEDDENLDSDGDIYLLRRELTLLSEKYRRATILYYIDRKSCSEISDILTISESMVKYLLFKSRKLLKEGMNMERNLGALSYNPKTLIPMYSGTGPNQFSKLMESKIKQNIVIACYNDSLTVQQISLETGIPLPYLDDEIRELEEREILIKDGTHYKSNVIVITSDCADEIERAVSPCHERIAAAIGKFLDTHLSEYKKIGFVGSDFSDNTLRWQLAVVLFRVMRGIDCGGKNTAPETAWGDKAYLWCVEKLNEKHIFRYCGVDSKHGDSLYFFDYRKDGKGKGDHHDFYGNERYINIFCDICRGESVNFSEYDLEAVGEMIRKGYVMKENDKYKAATPIYTVEQYGTVISMVREFIESELVTVIREMEGIAAEILSSHTPKHLQKQVPDIAGMDMFVNVVCIPATVMIEKGYIHTDWHPSQMPTTYVVVNM